MARIFIGTLISTCLFGVLGAGLYYLSLTRAESTLTSTFANHIGGSLSYAEPQWLPHWGQLRMRLPNVLVRMPLQQSGLVVAELPDLIISSNFFQERDRLTITLPQTWILRLIPHRGSTQVWQVQQEGGQITFVQQGDKSSITMEAKIMRLSAQGGKTYSLQSFIASIAHGDSNTVPTVQLGAKNIIGLGVDEFFAGVQFNGWSTLLPIMHSSLQGGQKNPLKAIANSIVSALQQGAQLQVQQGTWVRGNQQVSAQGNVQLAKNGTLRGTATVTAHPHSQLATLLNDSALLALGDYEASYRRQQVAKEIDPLNPMLNITFHQGIAIINTYNVGPMNTLSNMVSRWF
jgi:hypothetical protein